MARKNIKGRNFGNLPVLLQSPLMFSGLNFYSESLVFHLGRKIELLNQQTLSELTNHHIVNQLDHDCILPSNEY